MEQYLRVGVIASTHGLKGEVKVFPTTDDPERFRKLKKIYLDTGKEYKELQVAGVKFFKNQVILKFKEFQDINEVEKYRGKDLLIDREQAVPLAENENFIVDLIDMDVYDEEEKRLGTLTDVLQTGANDVYDITLADGRNLLLPAIKDCVLNVDIESRVIKVHILEGLLD